MGKFRDFPAVFLLTLTAAAFSQTPPASAQPLTFEVASVKQAPPLEPQKFRQIGMKVDAARVDISGMTLAALINIAFKTKPYQVSGPSWLTAGPWTANLFDIHATLPAGATEKDVPEMLQTLLVERFGLKVHREISDQAIYALVIGKGGPKMKDSPPDEGSSQDDKPPQVSERSDGKGGVTVRGTPAGNMKGSMQDGILHMEMEKMSMSRLAEMLTMYLDRPVLDMTELKGNYQVALDMAQADMVIAARKMGMPGGMRGPDTGAATTEASDPTGNPIFQSVQQLGLKLEARKSGIGMLVIDHLEKTPSEN
jgi:uncharacterized protein (TIGR03435 family)